MRFQDIKRHLGSYGIYAKRKTTINHAFASAIAPHDDFDADRVRCAIRLLDQDPNEDLLCVYCDKDAETWDHVFATVEKSLFSGAGHRIGNLLPCCKPCNSKKGNRPWEAYIKSREIVGVLRDKRISRIRRYLDEFFAPDFIPQALPEYVQFLSLRDEILRLMQEADVIAADIRNKMKNNHQSLKQ